MILGRTDLKVVLIGATTFMVNSEINTSLIAININEKLIEINITNRELRELAVHSTQKAKVRNYSSAGCT